VNNNGFVGFWKKVGIIGSGIMVAAGMIGIVTAFAWRVATAPIIQSIAEERIARAQVDSMIVRQLRANEERSQARFEILAEGLEYPVGSRARKRTLDRLQR